MLDSFSFSKLNTKEAMVVSSEYPENVLITRLLTMYLPLLNNTQLAFKLSIGKKKPRISKFVVTTPFVFNVCLLGGGLLICEKILDEDKRGPKRALLESLTMLVATGGKERTASEYKHILDKHGFIVTQIKQLHQSLFMDAMLCIKK